MECLVRFTHSHENFRLPELKALATLNGVDMQAIHYDDDVGAVVPSAEDARRLISRSILAQAIYEVWGVGSDYERLYEDVKVKTTSWWPRYMTCSFKFTFDSFRGSRSSSEQVQIVEDFEFMGFEGPIRMKKPDEEFCVFEEYKFRDPVPKRLFLGRLLGEGSRDDANKFSLKKRRYISTTSMDAELALVGSNITLAKPGALFYDPFVGTASLILACSHHGAVTLGSDMDGRAIRGKPRNNVFTSYVQYGLQGRYMGGFVSDLTNTPLRDGKHSDYKPLFDGIVCDPPYGIREGLKVLGRAKGDKEVRVMADGSLAHLADDFIAPKRPYSFDALLADILDFAARTLVADGRLSFWMPAANDEDVELAIPMHAALELVSLCTQPFNKWSRRLLTYRRRRLDEIADQEVVSSKPAQEYVGKTADDLNNFRRRYFEGFKKQTEVT